MGYFILELIYGRYSKKLNEFGVGSQLLLSIGFVFWLLCLLFLFAGITVNDTWFCVLYGIGFPLALTIWGIIVRNKHL